MTAPKPIAVNPAIPADMARKLDEQARSDSHPPSMSSVPPPPPPPQGPAINPMPGFAFPVPQFDQAGFTQPPDLADSWSPWSTQPPPPQNYPSPPAFPGSPPPPMATLASQSPIPNPYSAPSIPSMGDAMAKMSLGPSSPAPFPYSQSPGLNTSPPPTDGTGLTASLPAIGDLLNALPTIQQPSYPAGKKLVWCRDVMLLIERDQQQASGQSLTTEINVGPVTLSDPQLKRLADAAIPIILSLAGSTPVQGHVAEAVYWRATLSSTGAFPEFVRHNPRSAFRDFEGAARGGYTAAWFRLGRDYENFNDAQHAKDCFERGVKHGVESCVYRMAMAHLMGQLGLPSNPSVGLPLLHRAATLASLNVPQPAYVYALLLLDEFSQITIDGSLFTPLIPAGSSRPVEARKHLERAAYLHFPAAQYKLGHCYEFAQPPFPFDALLSVQYYSLASEAGETEADMALSKWFLCGSEDSGSGGFEKDEKLAYTFAEKAARKGLPSAEFAMGYYKEVGVGGPKDIESAVWWYTKASEHGNADATERLSALLQPSPQSLSRQEHDNITEAKLVRKRTQAKQRSDSVQLPPSQLPPMPAPNMIDEIRKNTTSGPAAGKFTQSPQQQISQLPPVQEYPGPQRPLHQQSQPAPQPGRPQQQQQQFAGSTRYALADPGSNSVPPGATPRPQQGGRQPSDRFNPGAPSHGSTPPPQQPHHHNTAPPTKKPTGPATFAEMGIQGAKAEDKECRIM